MGNDHPNPNPMAARMRMQMDLKTVARAYATLHRSCERRLRASMRKLRLRVAQGAAAAAAVLAQTCVHLQRERDAAFRMQHRIEGLCETLRGAAAISDTSRRMMHITALLARDDLLNPQVGLRVCDRFTAAMENIDATEVAVGGALDGPAHGKMDPREVDELVDRTRDELVADGQLPSVDVDALFARARAEADGWQPNAPPSGGDADSLLEERLRCARAQSTQRDMREFSPFARLDLGASGEAPPGRQEAWPDMFDTIAITPPPTARGNDPDAEFARRLERLRDRGEGGGGGEGS
jgi:hypothetical protein